MYLESTSIPSRSDALSIPEQIRALEKLAQIDAELKDLQDQHAQERATLDGLKSGISRLDEKLGLDGSALAVMDKARGELIQDVRNMNQQLEHSREKLGRSRTERESNAAQRELEELRKLVRDREEEIGKLTADAESARQQNEATQAEHKRLLDDLNSREGAISSKLGEVDRALQAKQAERDGAIKQLPPQLYRRYDMIRSKRGTGIAQTTDGTCKACHMALPPQLFHRLRREPTLDQCPSCNRIIYFASPVSADSASAPPPAGRG
jgi:predicted  nucleic acid-binding Zn-ribbon protein